MINLNCFDVVHYLLPSCSGLSEDDLLSLSHINRVHVHMELHVRFRRVFVIILEHWLCICIIEMLFDIRSDCRSSWELRLGTTVPLWP